MKANGNTRAARRRSTGAKLSHEQHIELYSDLCDAVCRVALRIPDDDLFRHTSDVSRATANRIIVALVRHKLLDKESAKASTVASIRHMGKIFAARGMPPEKIRELETDATRSWASEFDRAARARRTLDILGKLSAELRESEPSAARKLDKKSLRSLASKLDRASGDRGRRRPAPRSAR